MSPTHHHEPFKSLGPLAWEDVDTEDNESLSQLFSTTFHDAEILIDSIPAPQTTTTIPSTGSDSMPKASTTTGRARAKTDSAVRGPPIPDISSHNQETLSTKELDTISRLRKDWKEVKVSPKENPLGISIYKLSSKDGKGAWFARRSVHSDSGLSFDKWRIALEREFAETLNRCDRKNGAEPGTGNIRGIGAEKRVERRVVEGRGALEMFQVSARFPGPTTPRDFVTLLLMSPTPTTAGKDQRKERKPRQFMLVSRPCTHPDCPPRQGFIRGVYESVEVIREIPVEKPLRRTRSSVDLSRAEVKHALKHKDKKAALNGLDLEDGISPPERPSSAIDADKVHEQLDEDDDETEMAIEWLMVTRSDPGGSVPRFMVEKGTPGGITNDANKFVRWLSSITVEELMGGGSKKAKESDTHHEKRNREDNIALLDGAQPDHHETHNKGDVVTGDIHTPEQQQTASRTFQTSTSGPQGFYGMISGALGAATSVVANTIGAFTGSAKGTDSELNTGSSEDDDDDKTDSDSEGEGYVSAEDWGDKSTSPSMPKSKVDTIKLGGDDGASTRSARSATLSSTTSSTLQTTPPSITTSATTRKRGGTTASHHEKELLKLQERKKKAEEKLARAQARRLEQATTGDETTTNDKELAAQAKLRERHEKEMAKQEAKYQRELKKLEEKRANEERKAQEKLRRQREKEEKANVGMELERVKAERDVALKEIEILKDQVGDLQGQNTKLVAILGRHGLLPGAVGIGNGSGSGGSSAASLDVEG